MPYGGTENFMIFQGEKMPDNDGNFPDDGSDENFFRRSIKTYVIRSGRMTENEKRCYEELRHVWGISFGHRTLNFTDIFNNTNPVVMEIGFGMGQATSLIAQQNPETNYLGSEVHVPGVGRLLGEIKNHQLKNLFIIQHDALEVLEAMIPDDSLAGYHIFFPDPWQKKRHHKRRMIQRPHTELLAQKLSPCGYIYFVTDWEEYARSALSELSQTPGIHNKFDGFAPHQEWRPRTKFEQKGLDAGRKIYEIIFEKDEA